MDIKFNEILSKNIIKLKIIVTIWVTLVTIISFIYMQLIKNDIDATYLARIAIEYSKNNQEHSFSNALRMVMAIELNVGGKAI